MKLNQQCIQILDFLMEQEDFKNIGYISSELGHSERSVRYSLEKIDVFLGEQNLPALIRHTRKGVLLPEKNIVSPVVNKFKQRITPKKYRYSQEEVQQFLLLKLLLSEEVLPVTYFEEVLFISRSSVLNHLRAIEGELFLNNLDLSHQPRHGFLVTGNLITKSTLFARTTFEAIVPLVVLLFGAVGLSILMQSITSGQIIPEAFTTMLAPAINSIDTPYAVFLICFLEMLFWFIGLNGYAILIGFVLPFMTQYLGANAAAYAAGEPIPHVFAPNFWDYFMGFSGSGITGALVILALFSKSKELKAVGKVSVVPAIFTISEPVVFGLPICFNPYLFIPFVLGTPILAVGQWFVFHFGWVRPPIANVGGTPIPLAQYLATMDWRAIVLIVFVLAAAVCMYYPFFKMYEKSLIKEEAVVSEREAAHDALNLDF